MLGFLDRELTKSEREKVEKYMSQYRNLATIIESKKIEAHPNMTSSIKEDAVQESNGFSSSTEDAVLKLQELNEIVTVKYQLDVAYNQAKPIQKLIWDEYYIDGRKDYDIYYNEFISKRTYYREKRELVNVVATCLGI